MTDTKNTHREDVSNIAEDAELNPEDRSPPNAENRDVWTVLTSSTGLAVGAMIAVAVFAAVAMG